jgi:hypothetical protein
LFRYAGIFTLNFFADVLELPFAPFDEGCLGKVLEAFSAGAGDRCLFIELVGDASLTLNDFGMISMMLAIFAASECVEPMWLTSDAGPGRFEDVGGRICRSGRTFAFFPDEPICNLWSNEGRLLRVSEVDDPSATWTEGAAPALSVKSVETVVVTLCAGVRISVRSKDASDESTRSCDL